MLPVKECLQDEQAVAVLLHGGDPDCSNANFLDVLNENDRQSRFQNSENALKLWKMEREVPPPVKEVYKQFGRYELEIQNVNDGRINFDLSRHTAAGKLLYDIYNAK